MPVPTKVKYGNRLRTFISKALNYSTKAWPEAIAAASKAVTLDENLAIGYLAKALIEIYFNWNWSEADKNLKRALEIEPENIDMLLQYSWLKSVMNNPEESRILFDKAQKLAPDSPRVNAFHRFFLVGAGKFEEAKKLILNDIKSNPGDPYGYWIMSVLCSKEGSHEEAVKHLNIQIPLMNGDIADELALLGYNYGRLGQTDKALEQLAKLDELAGEGRYVSPVDKAWIYCGINEKDSAMAFLEKGFAGRANRMGTDLLFFSFIYQPIADDPRFTELLKKSNLQ